MNSEYDIRSIFEEMELELIRSMRRNLAKHQKWEEDEGINWTMWQAEQLKSFDKFKKENEKIFGKRFATVNAEIREFLEHTYETAGLDQEKEILNALANNQKIKEKTKKGLEGSFFNLNKKKMNALINATTNDLSKAEHAMLRLTNDQYRKIIYKAETMFNSGGFTLKQAIDAASKDFLKAGINCVEYKDGRRVNIASYAEMCLRTSNKRAKFVAEGDVRKSYGITTVKISRYGGCSETCLPWQGRVYVDDVWSGGTKEEAEDKKLPLLSTAIEGGLFHPNCKHSMFTYYYDRKKAMGKLQEDGVEVTPEEQEHRRNHLHIQQKKRLEEGSLDPQNIQEAKNKKEQWIEKEKELMFENTGFLNPYKDKDLNDLLNVNHLNDNRKYILTKHIFSNGLYELDPSYEMDAKLFVLENGTKLYVPNNLDSSKQRITVDMLENALKNMPKSISQYLEEIELVDYQNPQDSFISQVYGIKNFVSSAIGGDKKVIFFPSKKYSSIEAILKTLYHESAHILEDEFVSKKGFGLSDSDVYRQVMQLDEEYSGKKYSSSYAKSSQNNREDLADSLKLYFMNHENFVREFPNRTEFIKGWLKWVSRQKK